MDEIILYADANFQGISEKFNKPLPHIGILSNKVTSVRVRGGIWQLYTEPNYQGRSITLYPGDYPNIAINPGGIPNDSITSIHIAG